MHGNKTRAEHDSEIMQKTVGEVHFIFCVAECPHISACPVGFHMDIV